MNNEVEELGKNKKPGDNENKPAEQTSAEGGWGYVACFGMIICFIAGMGHINSFGLIYNNFIVDTQSSAKSLTTAHGTFAMMLAVGGIILNALTKSKLSLRQAGFLGAVMFCIGSFMNIFITNTNQLPFTFGVLQGIGFGIIVPVCYATINYYFIRKRTTIMSVCKAIQGCILMWYPQLIKNIIVQYGFKGTLLIISSMSLHMFPGVAVMRTSQSKQKSETENQPKSRNKSDELHNLIAMDDNQAVANANKTQHVKTRFTLQDILCLKILEDIIFVNICIGQSFTNFSDLTFFVLQPMLLFQYGYDQTEVATCISIGAGADVTGRFILAAISGNTSLNTRRIFYVATFLTLFMRLVLLQVRKFMWMAVTTACLGILRAWLHVTSPLVISNHVDHKDFPGAYALFLLAGGFINITLSPLIGILKDVYEDYVPAFYALTLCCLPCLILWPIEWLWRYLVK